jgi:hypothetical protein
LISAASAKRKYYSLYVKLKIKRNSNNQIAYFAGDRVISQADYFALLRGVSTPSGWKNRSDKLSLANDQTQNAGSVESKSESESESEGNVEIKIDFKDLEQINFFGFSPREREDTLIHQPLIYFDHKIADDVSINTPFLCQDNLILNTKHPTVRETRNVGCIESFYKNRKRLRIYSEELMNLVSGEAHKDEQLSADADDDYYLSASLLIDQRNNWKKQLGSLNSSQKLDSIRNINNKLPDNLQEPKHTYDLNTKFTDTLTSEKQSVYKKILKIIKHVSFNEFMTEFHKCIDKLMTTKLDIIYLIIDTSPRGAKLDKSNFWLVCEFVKYFDKKGWDAKTIKVIIEEDIEDIKDDKINVVMCDDMTYSGGQLSNKCEALLLEPNVTVHVICPYFTFRWSIPDSNSFKK